MPAAATPGRPQAWQNSGVAENAVLHFEQGRITEVGHCPHNRDSFRFACSHPTLHSRASSESGQAQGQDDDSLRVAIASTITS